MFKRDEWVLDARDVMRVSFERRIQLCIAQNERIAEGEGARYGEK